MEILQEWTGHKSSLTTANLHHDLTTVRAVTGILYLVNQTHVDSDIM